MHMGSEQTAVLLSSYACVVTFDFSVNNTKAPQPHFLSHGPAGCKALNDGRWKPDLKSGLSFGRLRQWCRKACPEIPVIATFVSNTML